MKESVGKLIDKAITKRGITQTKLADMLNRSQGTISDLISERRNGTIEIITQISNALILTKEEEFEIWKAWSLSRSHPDFITYVNKLEKENKTMKKLLKDNNN